MHFVHPFQPFAEEKCKFEHQSWSQNAVVYAHGWGWESFKSKWVWTDRTAWGYDLVLQDLKP
jgi:hypothetical protein